MHFPIYEILWTRIDCPLLLRDFLMEVVVDSQDFVEVGPRETGRISLFY